MADVEGFLTHWGLDDGARTALLGLPPEAQLRVMSEFAPKAKTKNVNSLFHGFCRSVQNTYGGQSDAWRLGEECQAWCFQRGLEMICVDTLLALRQDQREAVMQGFAPKQGTKNPTALFLAYCRSMSDGPVKGGATKGVGKAGKTAPSEWATSSGKGAPYGASYGAAGYEWGPSYRVPDPQPPIRARAAVGPAVWSPPPVQYQAAKGTGKGAGKAAAPVTQVSATPGGPSEQQLTHFLQMWGLDEESSTALTSHSAEVQQAVLDSFMPKHTTRNVKQLFMGFLKSVSTARGSIGGASMTSMTGSTPVGPEAGEITYAEQPETEDLGLEATDAAATDAPAADSAAAVETVIADAASAAATDHELNKFVETWGLDLECWDSLYAKPPDVRRAVMAKFKPKQGTRDVKNLFMGFLKSMASGAPPAPAGGAATNGWTPGAGQPRPNGKRSASTAFGDDYLDGNSTSSDLGGSINSLVYDTSASLVYDGAGAVYDNASSYQSGGASAQGEQEVLSFAQTWGLDTSCVNQLMAQAPDVQRHVLDSFKPKPGTRDVNSLFHGFLKSMVYGPGKGKGKRARMGL